jgi:hypothetical protein
LPAEVSLELDGLAMSQSLSKVLSEIAAPDGGAENRIRASDAPHPGEDVPRSMQNTEDMDVTPSLMLGDEYRATSHGLNWGLILGIGSCVAFWAIIACTLVLL